MPKRAISVTLDVDNLVWLRAQAGTGRKVSRIVNELVSEARAVGRGFGTSARSVAGTVDLRNYDPAAADREVRALVNGVRRGKSAVRRKPAPPSGGRGHAGSR